jgi:hypothetical protein
MRAARVSASSAIQWMKARFDGRPAPDTCIEPKLSSATSSRGWASRRESGSPRAASGRAWGPRPD